MLDREDIIQARRQAWHRAINDANRFRSVELPEPPAYYYDDPYPDLPDADALCSGVDYSDPEWPRLELSQEDYDEICNDCKSEKDEWHAEESI